MKRVALQKAAEHLDLAKSAIQRMSEAKSFKAYEQGWVEFLAQASRFYSKLEQGAKGCDKSTPWFGKKKHERRKDSLLSYIHHARDCEEHTIDYTASITADMLQGQLPEQGEFKMSCTFMLDKNGKQHFRNIKATGPDGEDLPVELVNPQLALTTVYDRRFGDHFDPPTIHLTRPIVDTTPRGIANLAIQYLEEMLKEAGKLPQHF